MTSQPAECTPACSEQHTYQLSTCALACTEQYGGVADPSWAVPCPKCKATADRPCTRWDGSAASVACQKRWDLFDQEATAARQAQAVNVADAFEVPLHLIDTNQPVEHCGNLLPPLIGEGPVTECVLRPGHQGSHANHDGARWMETPGADGAREQARRDSAASRESERVLQRQIDAQAKEIDRLQATVRRARKLADQWFVGGPTPVHIQAGKDLFAALEPPQHLPA